MTALLLSALVLAAATGVNAEAAAPVITPAPVAIEARQSGAAATYETTSPLPLTEYKYPYDAQPEQVNPYPILRGPQTGYNRCNSTTEGPNALCQTAVFNSIEDFCFWGAPGTNQTIGDVEAEVISFCSRAGHGGRIFPPGTFKGLQFMRTPGYIQLVGVFDQTSVGLNSADTGGELDPHALTWSQPSVVATPPPWTPRIPASSNCVTHQSSDLFPLSLLGYQSTATASATASVSFSAGPAGTTKAAPVSGSGSGSGSAAASTSKPSSSASRASPIAAATILGLAASVLFML
ncbi:hypothetical protein CspHIS471_0207130 [Cutaneotrichosporon sp. HIS471]|nr:hypothetical protein CspHIS471_0207130 [Cutaneotrichosporon sp. HIS471]